MKKKNPIHPIVEGIRDFLRTFFEKKGDKPTEKIKEETLVELQNVSQQVAAFRDAYEKAMREQDLTEDDLVNLLRDSVKQLTEKERKDMEQIYRLRREAKLLHQHLGRVLEIRSRTKGKPKPRQLPKGFRKKGWKKL